MLAAAAVTGRRGRRGAGGSGGRNRAALSPLVWPVELLLLLRPPICLTTREQDGDEESAAELERRDHGHATTY